MDMILAVLQSDITAAVPMTASVKAMVVAAINAGMGAATIIAMLGGGGVIAFLIKKAFQSGVKKIIIAA